MLTEAAAIGLLVKLGYLDRVNAAAKAVREAIATFQRYYALPENGELNRLVIDKMETRVAIGCGVPDIQHATASGGICKWPTPDVRYFIKNLPQGIGEAEARGCYARAWSSWNAVSGLRAVEVESESQAHVVMDVGRGKRMGFDGPSGVLAWSELPCGTSQVLQRYDLDEQWGVSATSGRIALENVACHEIGHALGISHIAPSLGRALMNPTYSPNVPKPLDLDIAEARKRYGNPATPQPGPQPGPTPTPGKRITIVIDNVMGPITVTPPLGAT